MDSLFSLLLECKGGLKAFGGEAVGETISKLDKVLEEAIKVHQSRLGAGEPCDHCTEIATRRIIKPSKEYTEWLTTLPRL